MNSSVDSASRGLARLLSGQRPFKRTKPHPNISIRWGAASPQRFWGHPVLWRPFLRQELVSWRILLFRPRPFKRAIRRSDITFRWGATGPQSLRKSLFSTILACHSSTTGSSFCNLKVAFNAARCVLKRLGTPQSSISTRSRAICGRLWPKNFRSDFVK